MISPISILVAASITALMQLIYHYIILPYYRRLKREELPTLARYVLGAGTITAADALLHLWHYDYMSAVAIIVIACVSGLVVFLAYSADAVISEIAKHIDAKKVGQR